jgi:uncharacterized repeat protein (TIGR01451 family)
MNTASRASAFRGALRLTAALLLAAFSIIWPGAARADEPPGPAPGGGVVFVAAWTNDDGVVDDATDDAGDLGDVSTAYDAHGTDSSNDPSQPGFNPVREVKDVAICTIGIVGGSSAVANASVGNAYPGYVCTLVVTLSNDTGVPADVAPAVIVADDGLTVGQVGVLPDTLAAGEQAIGVFFVQVDQSAPENATLTFTITLDATGEHPADCVPLTDADLPSESDILIEKKSMCVYFFDAKEKECGPAWTEEKPFSWQFEVKKSGGDSVGTLKGVFLTSPELTTSTAVDIKAHEHKYYLYTPTADTLVGAYLSGIPGANLKLEGTCNDPDGKGHVALADLTLSVTTVTNGDGTVDVAFTLTNEGDVAATDVVVWERMDSGLRVVPAVLTNSGGEWLVPVLAAGETVTRTLTVSSAEPGTYAIFAEIMSTSGGDLDSIAGNGALGEDDFVSTLVRLPESDGRGSAVLAFFVTALAAAGVLAIIRRRRSATR